MTAEPYPDWKKGFRRALKWGLIFSGILTIPNLFIPLGDPAPGYSPADVLRHHTTHPDFWLNILWIFGMFFAIVFVIATIIGAFRPVPKGVQGDCASIESRRGNSGRRSEI